MLERQLQARVRHRLDGVLVDERQLIEQRIRYCLDETVVLRMPLREGHEYGGAGNLAVFQFLELADRPHQVASQARPLPEVFFGDDLEERYGMANPFAVDEEFAGEELAQANGPTFHGD